MNPIPQAPEQRIESWLCSVIGDGPPKEAHAHPAKRACRRGSNDDAFLHLYNAPNTPPLIDINIKTMQSSTPTAWRKRRNDGDLEDMGMDSLWASNQLPQSRADSHLD